MRTLTNVYWNEEAAEWVCKPKEYTVANLGVGHVCILVDGRAMTEYDAKEMVCVLNEHSKAKSS